MNRFKEGDRVVYECEDGTLLGPFDVLGIDDEGPDIFELGPGGQHVHAIRGSEIIYVGWPKPAFDLSRFRMVN